MKIRLQATLPNGSTEEVGSYISECRPAINEHILLHLHAGINASTNEPVYTEVRFLVTDVLHVAFNNKQTEAWIHPWNDREGSIIATVEANDRHAEAYLLRLTKGQSRQPKGDKREDLVEKARGRVNEHALPKWTEQD